MKKVKVFKFGKKKYIWRFEDMDSRLVTALGLLFISLCGFWFYMFFYVLIFFGSAWR